MNFKHFLAIESQSWSAQDLSDFLQERGISLLTFHRLKTAIAEGKGNAYLVKILRSNVSYLPLDDIAIIISLAKNTTTAPLQAASFVGAPKPQAASPAPEPAEPPENPFAYGTGGGRWVRRGSKYLS